MTERCGVNQIQEKDAPAKGALFTVKPTANGSRICVKAWEQICRSGNIVIAVSKLLRGGQRLQSTGAAFRITNR